MARGLYEERGLRRRIPGVGPRVEEAGERVGAAVEVRQRRAELSHQSDEGVLVEEERARVDEVRERRGAPA